MLAVFSAPCRQFHAKAGLFLPLLLRRGRGWITQAAHLKKPRRGFFPPDCSAGRCCSNPPTLKTQTFCKQKTASVSLRWRSFYGRGWITQAAHLKKPPQGLFSPPDCSAGRCCSNPPALKTQTFCKQKTASVSLRWRSFYGRGWIRTTEAEKQQIYSLSPLATREHAHILFTVIADCLYILSSEVAFVNYFFHGFSLFLSFSIFLRFTAIKALSITAKDPKTFSVLRSFWSW